ncbi:hypothetical protein CONPUDRAFT_160551 [Coniophora puteana RWD-64-598 SS2]|uniref:Uncharacterized protein n=1 Tax=Coniophora puteana (strain RWD-64-598) TaxID=741705 RepID=R7SDD0_CONPW|nr:uncharacterized protein CONPUDRAFT_160551 [Coniophora puteana RWD-64-598 SS2]XP_007776071.1 uncharacterized protein CONPUDRAFT_160755 [Coniophora puteana RWD-64-598 SS2]EIW73752.1 hypothetical protein CONPUDRAFT_160755 [Coniophora puteana RWD-64-598 SS2]EIW73937.1 hypothetical protein CONPUDRAFT_160551 [Coniophora puteana RWD-64-598 SS2]
MYELTQRERDIMKVVWSNRRAQAGQDISKKGKNVPLVISEAQSARMVNSSAFIASESDASTSSS